MLAGATIAAGGMFWFSQLTVNSDYVNGLLGPMLVTSIGLGMMFVPLSIVALNRVGGEDAGVASSLLNTGQQVGGAIGLAALGTVTWTAVSDSVKHQVAQAAAGAAGHWPAAASQGRRGRAGIDPASGAGLRHRSRVPGRGRDRCARPDRGRGDHPVAPLRHRGRRPSVPDDASGITDGSELEGSVR